LVLFSIFFCTYSYSNEKEHLFMDFTGNKAVLAQVVAEHAVIRHISQHRKPDGTMDVEGNLKLWNDAVARFDSIQLWENGAPGFEDHDPLHVEPNIIFVPGEKERGCIIVAHGGGFETRTGCEGMNTAKFFNDAGYSVAILTYRLRPYSRIDAMADMQRAIRLLRSRCKELGFADRIVVMGFSAGGMMSANCATHFDAGDANAADPIERFSSRPDAAVISYGAFTFLSNATIFFSRLHPLAGRDYDEAVYLAPEHNVKHNCPPFFIWQTLSDDGRHGMTLARALEEVRVPYELHIFAGGAHGCALADGENDLAITDEHVAQWAPLCVQWLEKTGI